MPLCYEEKGLKLWHINQLFNLLAARDLESFLLTVCSGESNSRFYKHKAFKNRQYPVFMILFCGRQLVVKKIYLKNLCFAVTIWYKNFIFVVLAPL